MKLVRLKTRILCFLLLSDLRGFLATGEKYKSFDVIGIDEGQFFDDVRHKMQNSACCDGVYDQILSNNCDWMLGLPVPLINP